MQEYISTSITSPGNSSAIKTIVRAGFTAGVLDIIAAIITFVIIAPGKNPVTVLNYIASGAFGKENALAGGISMAILGLIFHFMIAFAWSILFYLMYPYFNKIIRNKWLAGIFYGVLVWIVMNMVVIPISNTPKSSFRFSSAIIGMLTLIIFLGIPISLITHHYYKQLRKEKPQ